MQARSNSFKHILLEALLVGVSGIALALVANAVSPRGLRLTRNYSPGRAVAATRSLNSSNATNGLAPLQLLEKQFAAEGLQLVDRKKTFELFEEPGRQLGLVLFVDARSDEHYQEGHIPGALQLDHYYPERYLATVLPACQVAQKIVVYCTGGSCEDSEQTAIFLRDAGIPKERLFVYAGGFNEWVASHLPVETGDGAVKQPGSTDSVPAGGGH